MWSLKLWSLVYKLNLCTSLFSSSVADGVKGSPEFSPLASPGAKSPSTSSPSSSRLMNGSSSTSPSKSGTPSSSSAAFHKRHCYFQNIFLQNFYKWSRRKDPLYTCGSVMRFRWGVLRFLTIFVGRSTGRVILPLILQEIDEITNCFHFGLTVK